MFRLSTCHPAALFSWCGIACRWTCARAESSFAWWSGCGTLSAVCWREAGRLKSRPSTYFLSIQKKIYVTVGFNIYGTGKFIFSWTEDVALPSDCG